MKNLYRRRLHESSRQSNDEVLEHKFLVVTQVPARPVFLSLYRPWLHRLGSTPAYHKGFSGAVRELRPELRLLDGFQCSTCSVHLARDDKAIRVESPPAEPSLHEKSPQSGYANSRPYLPRIAGFGIL